MYSFTSKINLNKSHDVKLSAEQMYNKVLSTGEGYEVITPGQPVLPYYDYDIYYHSEEDRLNNFDRDMKLVITEMNKFYKNPKLTIFTSCGIDTDKQTANNTRDDNIKQHKIELLELTLEHSKNPNEKYDTIQKEIKSDMRVIRKPIPYFKNSINIIVHGCGYYKSNIDILKPTIGKFDRNVYKNYQLIRAPFASKSGQNRFKNVYIDSVEYNIDTYEGNYEDLLITNIESEELIIDLNEISIDDVELSDDDEVVPENVSTIFKSPKHLKYLLLCLNIERIDNMNDWLVLMRICKNIVNTFISNDKQKAIDITHKHMEQMPDKYKFNEVELFLNKEELEIDNPATWGTLAKMAFEDKPRHYEKLLKRASKIKKGDIFNEDRIKQLMSEPRKYYWGDYGIFNGIKTKEPDEILKYMIDTTYKIMNGGKPYYITMNKTFKEFTKKYDMVFNYEFKTINQNPFNAIKKCCMFKIGDVEYDMFDFSVEFFQRCHFMSAEMLPYPGLDDPFKENMQTNYRILNRFEGFRMSKYTATYPGTCEKMLYHIKEIVCGGDEKLYIYVLGWLAWIIQKPDQKHETCLLLQGVEGCGKNKLVEIVKRVLGETLCFDTYNIEDIIGGFNSQLSGKLLIIGDELVGYAGFKKSDFIKGMLTSPNISITKKGVDTIAEKSFQRYIFTTNNDETLRISNNDRRICIIGVLDTMKGNYKYFGELTAEMDDLNNIKCLFDYLANYDLTDYDFRNSPETALKTETINNQMDDIYNWFIDYTDSVACGDNELRIKSMVAYDSYREYTNKVIRRKDFNNKMIKLLKCEYRKMRNGRHYIFNVEHTNNMFKTLYKNDIIIIDNVAIQEDTEIVNIPYFEEEAPYDPDDSE